MTEQGKKIAGALAKDVKEKSMKRLSPGVYRGEKGGLVSAKGRAISRSTALPGPTNNQPGIANLIYSQPGSLDDMQRWAAAVAYKNMPEGGYQTTPMVGVLRTPPAPDMNSQMAAQQTMQGAPAGIERLPYKMIPAEYRDAMQTLQAPQQPMNPMYGAPEAMPIMTNRGPQPWSNMPQPSANQGGQYRLSPGVYGTREQAMNQYNQQMQERLEQNYQNMARSPARRMS